MEPRNRNISPWIAWSLVALFFGTTVISTWYYYQLAAMTIDESATFFGVNVHKSKTATPSTSTSTATSKPTSTDLTYTNSTYGFTLTFPATWKGYKMKEAKLTGEVITYYVEVPTKDANFSAGDSVEDANYYSPFAISVFTLAQWNAVQSEEGPHDTLIVKNNTYAFAWSQANGVPASDFTMSADIKTIIASFKLK